jgi:hypothetical protein
MKILYTIREIICFRLKYLVIRASLSETEIRYVNK